jgi:hypothetical protein
MDKRRGPARSPDTEFVVFNGITYTRRPGRKYFKTMRWDKQRKRYYAESLHQAVWKFHRGEIPAGRDVHHKDDDYDNNAIENLELLTRSEHAKHHDRFREFNASPEAREHHSQIGKAAWANCPERTGTCRCGTVFLYRAFRLRQWCSNKCRRRFKKFDSGVRSGS